MSKKRKISDSEQWETLFHKALLNNDLMKKIKKDIDDFENKKGKLELIKLAKDYGGCKDLKIKVANEGVGYFYNSYTNVNAPYDLYESYVETDSCWCGICVNDAKKYFINKYIHGCFTCSYWKTKFQNYDKRSAFFKEEYLDEQINEEDYDLILDEEECWCSLCETNNSKEYLKKIIKSKIKEYNCSYIRDYIDYYQNNNDKLKNIFKWVECDFEVCDDENVTLPSDLFKKFFLDKANKNCFCGKCTYIKNTPSQYNINHTFGNYNFLEVSRNNGCDDNENSYELNMYTKLKNIFGNNCSELKQNVINKGGTIVFFEKYEDDIAYFLMNETYEYIYRHFKKLAKTKKCWCGLCDQPPNTTTKHNHQK